MSQLGLFDLSGKVAIVTGASMGFGVMFAHVLAEAGADVAVTARTKDLLEQTAADVAKATGRKVSVHPGDVAKADDVRRVVAEVLEQHGRIDIVVNNAGISDLRALPSEHLDHETFHQVMDVDFYGVWYFSREVAPHMLERGSGSIINIASILGQGGSEYFTAHYHAAKGAVLQLSRQLAVEWADRGVRVNAIAPGFFMTEMTRPFLEGVGMAPWIESRTPMRRLGDTATDLVGPVLLLASDAGAYITGQTLFVDGGHEACRGAWQMTPSHHFWNKDQPKVGTPYEGLVPNEFESWKQGIPGIHFPLPEG